MSFKSYFKYIFGSKFNKLHQSYLVRMRATCYQLAEKCPSSIWDELIKEIMNAEEKRIDKTIKMLNERNISAEAYIKQIIYNVCSDRAESGYYHIYRGFLNPIGEEYWKITRFVIFDLVNDGVFKQEWAENQLSIIAENIDSVG